MRIPLITLMLGSLLLPLTAQAAAGRRGGGDRGGHPATQTL